MSGMGLNSQTPSAGQFYYTFMFVAVLWSSLENSHASFRSDFKKLLFANLIELFSTFPS